MSRKVAAAAVLLLCIGALATATAEPQAADAAPTGGFMRRLMNTKNFWPLGSILGGLGGSSYASATAYAGSGYYPSYYGGYDPYYYNARPYYGGYYPRRYGPGRGYYGRKLA